MVTTEKIDFITVTQAARELGATRGLVHHAGVVRTCYDGVGLDRMACRLTFGVARLRNVRQLNFERP